MPEKGAGEGVLKLVVLSNKASVPASWVCINRPHFLGQEVPPTSSPPSSEVGGKPGEREVLGDHWLVAEFLGDSGTEAPLPPSELQSEKNKCKMRVFFLSFKLEHHVLWRNLVCRSQDVRNEGARVCLPRWAWTLPPCPRLWGTISYKWRLPCCVWLKSLSFFLTVQSLSHVQLFVTPWTAACQASLFFTIPPSFFKLMSIMLVMPLSHLILCHPLLLLFNLPQHRGLFQWVGSFHQVAKVLEFQLQHQSFQWIVKVDFL